MKKNLFSNAIFGLAISLLCHPALSKPRVDCSPLKGKTLEAMVVYVADGDTATVKLKNSKKVEVRFYGADTPESEWKGRWPEQAYSAEAKTFTIAALKNKSVKVKFNGEGTYSRCVGEIYVDNQSHSLALIKEGYAWWYSKYSPSRTDLKQAQAVAKHSKLGLWSNPNAQAPWDFRYQYK